MTVSSLPRAAPTSGELVTESTWYPSSDVPSIGSNQQPPVLHQTTRYVFSKLTIDGKPARAIDMTVTLKALQTSVFHDDKDGMLGIRVAHFLESATAKPEVLRDANGVATPVAAPTAGATGVYRTSEGKVGDDAWGTRGKWCELSGTTADGKAETIAVLDHTGNPNYPTYWHARDYGLFAVNPLGAHGFDPKAPTLNFTLDPGQSATFHYKILIISGTVTPEALNHQSDAFDAREIDDHTRRNFLATAGCAAAHSLRRFAPSPRRTRPSRSASSPTRSPRTSTTPAPWPRKTLACNGWNCAPCGARTSST